MISPLESKILDKNSECLGIPIEHLMDNAGFELAKIVDKFSTGRILFICGSGNNGGDGYAASSYLESEADYCAFKEPKSELCIKMSKKVEFMEYSPDIISEYDTIVDCVLGTGVEGTLRPEYSKYIDTVNASGKMVISCDVPTGYGTGKMIKANYTITFHDIKEGMCEDTCGEIIVTDINIPEEASTIVNKGDFLRYPVPKRDSHKGQNGRLIIIGGGPYVGAPACAGLAAVRTGADLVTIFTPKRSFVPIASMSASYIVKELSSNELSWKDVPTILKSCETADAILIGPGLGRGEECKEVTCEIVNSVKIPIVIDADGITNVSEALVPRENMIFTPHDKELGCLLSKNQISTHDIQEFCANGSIVLRKGRVDEIHSNNAIRYNKTGCSGMTVGGTGDVLAGIVSALLSKGMDPFDSACLGAHICGLAGEKAFDEHSYGMTAEDVISHIGHVLKEGLE